MKNLLVISSFPEKGTLHSDKTVGGAYYTKGILTALQKTHPELSITVYCEAFGNATAYQEDGMQIERNYKRNNLLSLFALLFKISTQSPDRLVISFEANMYGNGLSSLVMVIGMIILRILGKRPYLILQHVLGSFKALEDPSLKRLFLECGRIAIYRLLMLGSTHVIVFEEEFKRRLPTKALRVTVVPLFVPDAAIEPENEAKEKLGVKKNEMLVLYFGFLSPYKGVDWLSENWPHIPDTRLLIAGGANPNHAQKPEYKAYIKKVTENAKEHGIQTTGFVKETDLPTYFSAADCIILPYKTFFSSSGPLSLAYAYEKGLILSKELEPYTLSTDFKQALEESGVSAKDLTFSFEKDDLKRVVLWAKEHKEKIRQFSFLMKKKRNKYHIAELLYKAIQ